MIDHWKTTPLELLEFGYIYDQNFSYLKDSMRLTRRNTKRYSQVVMGKDGFVHWVNVRDLTGDDVTPYGGDNKIFLLPYLLTIPGQTFAGIIPDHCVRLGNYDSFRHFMGQEVLPLLNF